LPFHALGRGLRIRSPESYLMHRRSFLNPRHLAQTAGQLLAAADELSPSRLAEDPDLEEIALLRLGWRAMATGFEIVLPWDSPQPLEAGRAAFELLDCLEEQLSVYREHSEVSRLNRLAFVRPVGVEPRLFELLQQAQQIHQDTAGAFDITSGPLIKVWGFFRGPRRVPAAAELAAALSRVGMQHVVLTPERWHVRFTQPNMEINLGSIGKGYALDRLAQHLREQWNLSCVLLHGGNSSVYAGGDPLGTGRGWRVRIRHPWQPDRYLAEVWLRDRALGTSAATFQYLEHQGKKLGHILDPRTGWPASGLDSVSVIAPTGAEADALSTAFYVGGRELAQQYCAAHPAVGAILLPAGCEVPEVIGSFPDHYTILTEQA